ncbi:hypothetical protein KR093_006050 [Drosophila rubida]|uniref:Uncharacterized protein n=1 Tax=Drosophila rubida TaxID=30044 RepID=A0AAD4KDH6_9MUSC|nr:hypothetical protein KR093_006050 [Drosophila rubida]
MLVPRRGSSDHHRSQAVCTAVADGATPQHQHPSHHHHHQQQQQQLQLHHHHHHHHHHQQQRRTSNMEIIAEERNV